MCGNIELADIDVSLTHLPATLAETTFWKNVTSCHIHLAGVANTAPAKIIMFDHKK